MGEDKSETLYKIGLFLVNLLEETNATDFKYTLNKVHKQGVDLGDYQLIFKKIK